jgi:ParB-like chromosome segregation protein Spo0J
MTAVAAPTTPDLLRIPLAQITAHPANRKRFDPGQLDELARSLQTHGQLTPALVQNPPCGEAVERLQHGQSDK